jgi:hypothetical protein
MQKKICGNFPKFCYKAFECEDYAKQFMDSGAFRMGCLRSYREIKDESRRDPTEGSGHTKEPGIVTVGLVSSNPTEKTIWIKEHGIQDHSSGYNKAIFCFCTFLSDVNLDYIKEKFGKYIVKITDPEKLAEDIHDSLINTGQRFLIEGCNVIYNKGQTLEKQLTDDERLDMSYKQKPESFILECEFRIVAFKSGEPCKDECKFLSGQFEQVDPLCSLIPVNLGKQLSYTQLL